MARIAIDLEADIQPVSDFRAHTSAVLQKLRDTRRPVVLTQHGRGAAVLLDVGTYQDLMDELDELRDVHRGLADVAAGRTVTHEDAAARVRARLGR